MVTGTFVGNSPYIQTTLGWGGFVKSYWFVLDTGFTGDLQIPYEWGKELGVQITSVENFTIADGTTIPVPQGTAMAEMEGEVNHVQVAFSKGHPLMGIDFFTKFGYKVIVDCKNKTVKLKKA